MIFPLDEIKSELQEKIIPFWNALRDDELGGFYGNVDSALNVDKMAEKGCLLNSRILWFYSNAYDLLGDEILLDNARHAYEFLITKCYDGERGGVYWSVNADGTPNDTQKHTYNQAFAIYALSSYYGVSEDKAALDKAFELFEIVEKNCTDEGGYLEAFDIEWKPFVNDKLSENGVMASRTMNTLLHVMEAYTELYRVSGDSRVSRRLEWILGEIADRVYCPERRRLEVFFDLSMNSLIDLHSYGHDIEAAWLVDRACDVLDNAEVTQKMRPITAVLEDEIISAAYENESLNNECCCGEVDKWRVWWVQCEAIIGFFNAWQKRPDRDDFLGAAQSIWNFTKKYVSDDRDGGEWHYQVDVSGTPDMGKDVAGEWKCPYHNGRMCIEIMRRGGLR